MFNSSNNRQLALIKALKISIVLIVCLNLIVPWLLKAAAPQDSETTRTGSIWHITK